MVAGNLGLEAQLAGPDIPGDILLHTWPKVSPGDELEGLTNPGVSAELMVMVLSQDVQADLLMVQGIDLSVPKQELVVGGEGEEAVVVDLISRSVLRVVLSEEGVLGGIANLV
ncbi:hypothetical protein C0993_001062, partial [Termitomyces sp. T159_Od127]